jgi:hypothetical protein
MKGPELSITGVGVGVEMQNGDSAPAHVSGDTSDVWSCDCVVATQDDGNDSSSCYHFNGFFESSQGRLRVASRHLDISDINNP